MVPSCDPASGCDMPVDDAPPVTPTRCAVWDQIDAAIVTDERARAFPVLSCGGAAGGRCDRRACTPQRQDAGPRPASGRRRRGPVEVGDHRAGWDSCPTNARYAQSVQAYPAISLSPEKCCAASTRVKVGDFAPPLGTKSPTFGPRRPCATFRAPPTPTDDGLPAAISIRREHAGTRVLIGQFSVWAH
jgi:hypothetical protein